MDKMFKTIEEVQLLLNNLIPDSYMAVGGSFALYVAGLPLDHKPHDLDINWYVDPEDFCKALGGLRGLRDMYGFAISSSRGQNIAFRINDITIDVFVYSDKVNHTLMKTGGINFLSVGDVMNYKLLYGREKDKKCVDHIYNEWTRTLNRMSPSVYEKVTDPVIIRTEFPEGIVEGVNLSEEVKEFLNNARSFDDLVDRVIIAAGVKGIHIESKTFNPLGYELKFYTDSCSEIVIDVLNNGLPF